MLNKWLMLVPCGAGVTLTRDGAPPPSARPRTTEATLASRVSSLAAGPLRAPTAERRVCA
eukprot:1350295-Prymnesium_polylepis.1